MPDALLQVAVVGCGNIAGRYGETLQAYDTIRSRERRISIVT